MRSNDLIWGTPYNFIQFTAHQEILAGWLNVEVGSYTHISDSLHVYERHWNDLNQDAVLPTFNIAKSEDLRVHLYEKWCEIWGEVVSLALACIDLAQKSDLSQLLNRRTNLPPSYAQWITVLVAESLRRKK